ncbi:uncharacterized protein LOC134186336 isoform X3 [Corticium candelabrum]|uniref:uncharacterized protein LOC134186336 isoform X3 n=1 Tax=Corticium candelabrum TaxID=121492 RepID=UPI002E267FE3|nr:uncharacterized protein LOC134186336 isoform X3 [Corticium candelabrum]
MAFQVDEWQQYVLDNLPQLVKKLCVSSITDHLISHRLISTEEAHILRHCPTEEERCRILLCDVLPRKGSGSHVLDRFCEVLEAAGQQHIVREVMKRGGVVCADQPVSDLQTVQQQQTIQQSESNEQCDGLNGQEKSMTEVVQHAQQASTTAPTEDNCTREREELLQQKDGTSGSTVEATTPSKEEVDSEWKQRLKHCHSDLIAALRPCLFLDHLRGSNILSQEEHTELQEEAVSETDRSDRLLCILSCKGKGSFEAFCKILCNVEKQNHIVSEILKVQNPSLLPIDANRPLSGETIGQSDSSETLKRKRPHESSSDPPCSKSLRADERIPSATFIFRKIDKENVKNWKESIREMCRKCYKIAKENVMFLYSFPPAGNVDPKFFGDTVNKIAVIHLVGVAPDRVERHRSRLVSFVADFMDVKEDHIHYKGATGCSSLVLFQMRMDDYVRLFSVLAVEEQCIALYQTLKWIFPELLGVKFRLGGLPPVELINLGVSMERVLMDKGSNMRTLKINQMTMLSLSAIDLQFKYMNKQICDVSDVAYGLTDGLRRSKIQIMTLQKTILDAKNASKQNTLALDELENDRIGHAAQHIVGDQNSSAACFTRMKVRKITIPRDFYKKLDMIKWLQEEVETKLSQRRQLAERTSCCHTLLDGLQTRIANLKLSKKKTKTDPMISLPSWTQWNVHMPYDSWYSYNMMGELEGRLVVGSDGGNLHVLTSKRDKWDKFVRKNGDIRNVVCHQDDKWRFLTVLPNELQLDGVSVALHDNSLYVVGGVTKSDEVVKTVCVCDLHSGHWSKMADMQTKRTVCSSVIINNTIFVGGGWTDGPYHSNVVECADVRVRKWRTIPPTTSYDCAMTSISNSLVGTGGTTQQMSVSSSSNIVELYDERATKWLPLPHMTHKRWAHAAFSTQNGELITAGGVCEQYRKLLSIESLKWN